MPPLDQEQAKDLIGRRHPEWEEFQRDWRWLQDSLEGGNRYRYANYADDPLGVSMGVPGMVADPQEELLYVNQVGRNLIPHLSETTVDGIDTYTMRLARTPIPRTVARTIGKHLSRVYSKEVVREGPQPLIDWWANVDGAGTPIDKWIRKVISPLFMVIGHIDLCFDHPAPPEGVEIVTLADQKRFGLDECIVSYILPENLVWWRIDRVKGQYVECVVFERFEDDSRYRHWTPEETNAYDVDGKYISDSTRIYPYGRPPIVRVFDNKKFRCRNTGQSRYESIAELQKAIYNSLSELILGDVQQSHAILQGPEHYVLGEGKIAVGPNNTLPKYQNESTGQHEGWEYLDPQKTAQQEVRIHIMDFKDDADRDGALLKPAGMSTGSTVSQSGISKIADQQEGNDYLSEIAETLSDMETSIGRMVLMVKSNGQTTSNESAEIRVVYPKEFGLSNASDLSEAIVELQGIAAAAGDLPECTIEGLNRLVATMYPGMDDTRQSVLREEIEAFVNGKAKQSEMNSEAAAVGLKAIADQTRQQPPMPTDADMAATESDDVDDVDDEE